MDCDRFVEQRMLVAFGDTSTDPDWMAHRVTCSTCNAEIEEIAELRRINAAMPGPALSEAAKRRMIASVAPRRPVFRVTAGMAAMVAMAIFLPILVMRLGKDPVNKPSTPSANHLAPTGAEVDSGVEEVKKGVTKMEVIPVVGGDDGALDRELGELRRRMDGMKWDAKNM